MENFPPNSQKARVKADEPKKVERVTSADAVRRKKSLGRRFKDTFVGGDAKSAMQYVALSVIVPSAKDMLAEAAHAWTERLIYGETRPRKTGPSGYTGVGHVDYRGISGGSNKPKAEPPSLSRAARTRQDFGEIVIQHRGDAEEVIDSMYEMLSRYGSVSVADLYGLTGIRSEHTDHTWGWTDLRGAKPVPLRNGNGYVLSLPRPTSLR